MCGALLFTLSMAVTACGSDSSGSSTSGNPTPIASASATPTATPTAHLVECPQDFALCAAATCQATGGQITTNDGKTYPAASCTCPVLAGPAIANVNYGNMQGSCTPPAGGVWSLYQVNDTVPQAVATPAWSDAPAPLLICPGGDQFAQCWDFACTLGPMVNGVQLATCTCPIEVALTQFVSQAGLGGQAACGQIPIGAAVPVDPNSVP